MSKEYPWGKGTPNVGGTDSSVPPHTYTVPAGKIWKIYGAYTRYVASADVANRQSYYRVYDPSAAEIFSTSPFAVQTASQTLTYLYGPAIPVDLTGGAGLSQSQPVIDMILPAGYYIVMGADNFNVNDRQTSRLMYVEYDA